MKNKTSTTRRWFSFRRIIIVLIVLPLMVMGIGKSVIAFCSIPYEDLSYNGTISDGMRDEALSASTLSDETYNAIRDANAIIASTSLGSWYQASYQCELSHCDLMRLHIEFAVIRPILCQVLYYYQVESMTVIVVFELSSNQMSIRSVRIAGEYNNNPVPSMGEYAEITPPDDILLQVFDQLEKGVIETNDPYLIDIWRISNWHVDFETLEGDVFHSIIIDD